MENQINIVRPDSDGREKILDTNFIESSHLKISDDFVHKLMSKASFLEGLKTVDINFNNDEIQSLKDEVELLRAEVSELKQKLEVK